MRLRFCLATLFSCAVLVSGVAQAQRSNEPPAPAPRNSEGRVLLGSPSKDEKGVWLPVFTAGAHLSPLETIPFKPWAKALYDTRLISRLEPHARCKASPFVRQVQTPYGVEIVEIAELDRVFIFDIGGPHTFRTIYMDGRSHPNDPEPTNYGHSIGWWEGDTLVIDSLGFNEDFWMDRRGLPSTEQLHTVERLTRVNHDSIRYEVMIDDPGAYTVPFSGEFSMRWEVNVELFEYVCQQANYAHDLMVGTDSISIDRSSTIVP